MTIIPGRYTIRMSRMRLREYYRFGRLPNLVRGIKIKLGLQDEPKIGERRFPHTVAQEICTEEEMDPLVMARLRAVEERTDIGQRIFCVGEKEAFDSASEFKAGGCHTLLGEKTIGFYAYTYSPDKNGPGQLKDSEMFTCMSFSATKAFATTNNMTYGFDLPPEIVGHRMKGAPLEDVIARHLKWVSAMSLRAFTADDTDSIIKAIDLYAAYFHRDLIERGFYQLIEADACPICPVRSTRPMHK